MSYFNMVCDSCGREVHGCNIVNGMKFCAKCYQETFGETDKDKQIAELKQQLKSQPVEIVEKIREFCLTDHKFKECEIYLREDNGQTIYSFLDAILKEYQK